MELFYIDLLKETIMTTAKFLTVAESGAVFARSEVEAATAIAGVAHAIGTAPTFADWEKIRAEFQAAYCAVRPQADGGAKAWSRVAARMSAEFGLEKPKAPSKAAADKAESRKAAAAKIAQAATLSTDKLAALAAAGDITAADALKVKAKVAEKSAKADAATMTKNVLAKVKTANPLAQRIAYLAAQGDAAGLCTLICEDWPALASAIVTKVSGANKPNRKISDKKTS
jgi:hypothetical protein